MIRLLLLCVSCRFLKCRINLGQLFEKGLGLEKDPEMARFWYQKASGIEGVSFKTSEKTQDSKTQLNTAKAQINKAQINIVEPELQQSNQQFYTTWEGGKILVIGEVKSDIEITEVKINQRHILSSIINEHINNNLNITIVEP